MAQESATVKDLSATTSPVRILKFGTGIALIVTVVVLCTQKNSHILDLRTCFCSFTGDGAETEQFLHSFNITVVEIWHKRVPLVDTHLLLFLHP